MNQQHPVPAETADHGREPDDPALRPSRLADFQGQPHATKMLGMTLAGARARGETVEHTILHGPPGLGKTTLASILAAEAGVRFRPMSATSIERPGDLAAVLVTLGPGEVLFIDEIHRLPAAVSDTLNVPMEDFRLDMLAGGPGTTQAISIPLERFTLVGATTDPGMLSRPLRDRFGVNVRLERYSPDDMARIVGRSARLLGMELACGVDAAVAARSRGTPRVANKLLRRMRDFAAHEGHETVGPDLAEAAFRFLGIDDRGLDARDRRYIDCLKARSRPMGLNAIAAAIGELSQTLEEEVEPWLMERGFVDRTARGRVLGPASAPPQAAPAPQGLLV